MHKYQLIIPILTTQTIPREDGNPGNEVAIFYEKDAYFLVTEEQATFFNQFLVSTSVVPEAPVKPPVPVESARARMLREAASRINPTKVDFIEQEVPTPAKPKLVITKKAQPVSSTLISTLAEMGITVDAPLRATVDYMKVNEEAGPDGNSPNLAQLRALVQVLEDRTMAGHVRQQAMTKMMAIPMPLLYQSASFTSVETRKMIAAARSQQITLSPGEQQSIPMALATYIAGGDKDGVAFDAGEDGIVSIKMGGLNKAFQLPENATENPDLPNVREFRNDHTDNNPYAGDRAVRGLDELEQQAAARAPRRLSLTDLNGDDE